MRGGEKYHPSHPSQKAGDIGFVRGFRVRPAQQLLNYKPAEAVAHQNDVSPGKGGIANEEGKQVGGAIGKGHRSALLPPGRDRRVAKAPHGSVREIGF